ncbi:MAG TPA: c-type cytochrome [Wenzhouxiangellaceae bacterium]|nr:c-type cytochrome [Wenzhouxiangellaceae bacterium]
MSEQDDKIFMKRFSLVIAGLAVVAVLIIFFAIEMNEQLAGSDNPMQDVAKVDRIEPVFGVYAGDTGRAAAQAAAEEAAGSQQQQVAFDGSTDGEMIYNNVCQACHMAGAAGAPQLVADQWTDRLPQGEDTLVQHAIDGIGAMPAKGGRSDLTDEQVRASVEYMLAQIED